MKNTTTIVIFGFIGLAFGAWGLSRRAPDTNGASAQSAPKAEEYYTCPMHPAVRAESEGECPACGMDLVKKSVQPSVQKSGEYYTCPMHESVRLDHAGSCPVCGMTLVKKNSANRMSAAGEQDLKAVSLSPTQRVMANITTVKVHRRTISNDIQTVGVVSYAEPNYRILSMRFPGRIEALYLKFTGQTVRKGDPVADVYSPEATLEEQTFLRALDMYNETTRNGEEASDAVGVALRRQRSRLLQLGFTEKQIVDLSKSDTLSALVRIYSPMNGTVVKKNVDPGKYAEIGTPLYDIADLSTVWILLDVYEMDIPFLRQGQTVHISTEAYPRKKFTGRVVFIDPVLTPETRTVRVRTEFPNREGMLKPNMYVNATIVVPQLNALVVPNTAIISTGKRSVVWIETSENTFVPRAVVPGASHDGFTVVEEGLHEGDVVAATGGFLLDSESALSASSSNDFNQ